VNPERSYIIAKKTVKKPAAEPGTQNFTKLLEHLADESGLMLTEVDGQFVLHRTDQLPGGGKSAAAEMVEVATALGITPMIPGLIEVTVKGIRSLFNRDVHTDNVSTLSNLAQQARLYGYDKVASSLLVQAGELAAGEEDEE
jgi:hypothetical protein